METKTCTKCGEEKPTSAFYTNAALKDGRMNTCVKCWKARCAQHYQENGETIRAASIKYRQDNPVERQAYDRQYNLQKRFGLTLEQRDALLDHQRDCCLICLRPFTYESKGNAPHIDHDHVTGKVRGILCGTCNTGIGHLRDSVLVCKSALRYLESN